MEEMEPEYVERKRWLFLGLPFTFTKYSISEDNVGVKSGFFKSVEDDTYMYKVQDVKLVRSFWEKIFGLGTLILYSGDVTNPILELKHIKNTAAIKNYIRKTSEVQRKKVRTLHTMGLNTDISVEGDIDGDGIPD